MATVEQFGDLRFRTISPDEIAQLGRNSILYGLTAEGAADAVSIRRTVRASLAVLGDMQLPMLLHAFRDKSLDAEWGQLRDDIAFGLARAAS